jgi:hypothetical protein
VRLEYQALYGPAWEEKFHKAADTPPDKARAEHAAWAAKVKGRLAALRDSKGGKRVDPTQRQADALAWDWYRWFTSQHLDNPGSPDGYDIVRYEFGHLVVEAGAPETVEADFDDPEVLSEIDTLARASQFLTRDRVDTGRANSLPVHGGQRVLRGYKVCCNAAPAETGLRISVSTSLLLRSP